MARKRDAATPMCFRCEKRKAVIEVLYTPVFCSQKCAMQWVGEGAGAYFDDYYWSKLRRGWMTIPSDSSYFDFDKMESTYDLEHVEGAENAENEETDDEEDGEDTKARQTTGEGISVRSRHRAPQR